MEFKSDALLAAELTEWSKEALIDENHAIMLLGVPSTMEVACIEDTVQTIKAVGKVRVRDTKRGATPDTVMVLCECREIIDSSRIPAELLRADGEDPWRVIVASADVHASDFAEKLKKCLRDEGKSMSDVGSLFHSSGSNVASPESIFRW